MKSVMVRFNNGKVETYYEFQLHSAGVVINVTPKTDALIPWHQVVELFMPTGSFS